MEGFTEIVEGKTKLLVPALSLTERVPPKTPAFFNPAAKLNRDLSILTYRVFAPRLKERTLADGFTGVGARALRVAVEVPEIEQVYGNDANPSAIEAATKAAELNGVSSKCRFSVDEVCKFLLKGNYKEERFGIIDLDPFGTPARHVDCVLRAVLDSGLVSITATDTAVLCGVYPKVCRRRYYGRPLNNSYGNETAIRLLTSLIALTASRLELAIRPVFAHATMHYLRVYAQVAVSSSEANDVYSNLGYVRHCFNCGHRLAVTEYEMDKCELCQHGMRTAGLLWTGPLQDRELVAKMAEGADEKCNKVLDAAAGEIDVPYYFKADEISSKMRASPHSIAKIIEKLQAAGYRASKTSFNTGAFKTDARIDRVLQALS
ncbi:tRNA (guanine(10)-N(2))-dimethyltransferase [Nitrososphaera sp.]|uniref:tRNA (guanine(10)-N(2))-dimethyltransferase n=1 Tax=Nitrososphaera sp. TaxID=1971748 RepID=UPI002ED7E029